MQLNRKGEMGNSITPFLCLCECVACLVSSVSLSLRPFQRCFATPGENSTQPHSKRTHTSASIPLRHPDVRPTAVSSASLRSMTRAANQKAWDFVVRCTSAFNGFGGWPAFQVNAPVFGGPSERNVLYCFLWGRGKGERKLPFVILFLPVHLGWQDVQYENLIALRASEKARASERARERESVCVCVLCVVLCVMCCVVKRKSVNSNIIWPL